MLVLQTNAKVQEFYEALEAGLEIRDRKGWPHNWAQLQQKHKTPVDEDC